MTRPLSPDSSRIAADLIDQYYGAEAITETLDNMRTQSGQNSLPALGPAYVGWARTHFPVDPGRYTAGDVRAFRQHRAAQSASQPAFAGMPSRAAGSTADMPLVARHDPVRFDNLADAAQPAASALPITGLPLAAAEQSGTVSVVDYLASEYPPSRLSAALAAQSTGAIRHGSENNARQVPYPAGSSRSSASGATSSVRSATPAYVKLLPLLPEHRALLDGIPEAVDKRHRSCVNRFLCHLERTSKHWADLVPAERGPGWRSDELEIEVDSAMRHSGLHTSTRAALNSSFDMSLRLNQYCSWKTEIKLPEHAALLGEIQKVVKSNIFAKIRRFLVFLEQNQRSWSQLVPDALHLGARPIALENVINSGIDGKLPENGTRASINKVFGLGLQAKSGLIRLKPVNPEHLALLEQLPAGFPASYYSNVSRFFCHLEQTMQSWSLLVPAVSVASARPPLLEQAVTRAIGEYGLSSNSRAAINKAFGFALKEVRQ
jgi:hypothetical protein